MQANTGTPKCPFELRPLVLTMSCCADVLLSAVCERTQGMGTPLMTKLGSSKVMDAGADSHVPTPNARKQAATNPTFNNYKTADGRWIQLLGLETPRCALACGKRCSCCVLVSHESRDHLPRQARDKRKETLNS